MVGETKLVNEDMLRVWRMIMRTSHQKLSRTMWRLWRSRTLPANGSASPYGWCSSWRTGFYVFCQSVGLEELLLEAEWERQTALAIMASNPLPPRPDVSRLRSTTTAPNPSASPLFPAATVCPSLKRVPVSSPAANVSPSPPATICPSPVATVPLAMGFQVARLAPVQQAARLLAWPAPASSELPVSAPSELPVSAPSELSVSAPSVLPVSAPSELSVSAPSVLPVSAPSELPVSAPSVLPVSALSELSVSAPSKLPVSAPSDLLVSAPSDLPVSAPSDLLVSAPSELPVSALSEPPVSAPCKPPSPVSAQCEPPEPAAAGAPPGPLRLKLCLL
ncbi:calphotin-like isoform X4 [Poecilia reticulata]|uniref:calphotin-like isoform X4 n=1 Tax=Poecilia reticulata TaxID=8081 RepID=UPI0007EB4DC5|nr:PREDICTED: calphotin-like isoform X4 [Poecilia reticulata]